jgi:protein-S-isoprenylcysteine O-methyltransferase Ste14
VDSSAVPLSWPWRLCAWGGALVFVLSLGYFLFTYAFTFRETQQSAPFLPAVLWNVTVFTVFALHHSVFARERVRAAVARTVPPALERSLYVWIASLLFIGVCALWQPLDGVVWSTPSPFGWLLYALLATGVWLSVHSARVIDVWELAGVRQALTPNAHPSTKAQGGLSEAEGQRLRLSNSQISEVATQNSSGRWSTETVGSWEFKTSGPYGLVRHPIYLGWFLMVFGVPTMTMTRFVFALVSCGYLVMAIPFEERTLRRLSAGKYDEYMKLVRWRLVPGIY